MTDPFKSWAPDQIDGLLDTPDALADWRSVVETYANPEDACRFMEEAGNRLATELLTARSVAVALEQELHARTGDGMRGRLRAVIDAHREEVSFSDYDSLGCICGEMKWQDWDHDAWRAHLLDKLMETLAADLGGDDE